MKIILISTLFFHLVKIKSLKDFMQNFALIQKLRINFNLFSNYFILFFCSKSSLLLPFLFFMLPVSYDDIITYCCGDIPFINFDDICFIMSFMKKFSMFLLEIKFIQYLYNITLKS